MTDGMNQTALALQRFLSQLRTYNSELSQAQRRQAEAREQVGQIWQDSFFRRYDQDAATLEETLSRYLQREAPQFDQFIESRLRILQRYLGNGSVSAAAGSTSGSVPSRAGNSGAGGSAAVTPDLQDIELSNRAASLPPAAHGRLFLDVMRSSPLSAAVREKYRRSEQGGFQQASLLRLPDSGAVQSEQDFNHHISYSDAISQAERLRDVVMPWVRQGAIGEDFAELDRRLGLSGTMGYASTYQLFYNSTDAIRISKNLDGEAYVESGRHRLYAARAAGLDYVPIFGKAPWDS